MDYRHVVRLLFSALFAVLTFTISPVVSAQGKNAAQESDPVLTRLKCDTVDKSSVAMSFEGLSIVDGDSDVQYSKIQLLGKSPSCNRRSLSAAGGKSVFGVPKIEYEGGVNSERFAKVIPEPGNTDNHVLQFWLQSPNVRSPQGVPAKGRVQMDLYNNRNLRQVHYSVRMFLTKSFALLKDYPSDIDWMTVSEWWDNPAWGGGKYPFRISVNITKPDASAKSLYFAVRAQTMDKVVKHKGMEDVWFSVNKDFEIPTEKWMTLDYYWVEGDDKTGQFKMTVTPEDGATKTLFAETNFTHHPADPAPIGLTHLNLLKLYTSRQVIDYVKSRGDALSVYWDDLQIQ